MTHDVALAGAVFSAIAGHGGPNVVYRRANGNTGWVDPSPRAR